MHNDLGREVVGRQRADMLDRVRQLGVHVVLAEAEPAQPTAPVVELDDPKEPRHNRRASRPGTTCVSAERPNPAR